MQHLLTNMKKNQGFTLIELILVVAIIAVLAAAVLSILNPFESQKTARDSVRLSQITNISAALELYFAQYKKYPETPTSGTLDLSNFNNRISWSESLGCGIKYTKTTTGYTLIAPMESTGFKVPEGSNTLSIVDKPSDFSCSAVTKVILLKVTQ